MFELDRTTVKLRIYGEEYSVRVLTFDESEGIEKQLAECKTEEVRPLAEELFRKVGLPPELFGGLEMSHIFDLVSFLVQMDSKKK